MTGPQKMRYSDKSSSGEYKRGGSSGRFIVVPWSTSFFLTGLHTYRSRFVLFVNTNSLNKP